MKTIAHVGDLTFATAVATVALGIMAGVGEVVGQKVANDITKACQDAKERLNDCKRDKVINEEQVVETTMTTNS